MSTSDDNKPGDPVGVTDELSPNFNARPAGTIIDAVTLHADASPKAEGSTSWIKARRSKVSYHSLVERDGDLVRYVRPEHRAWHAGASALDGRVDVNDFSLGLCFSNKNDGIEEYTELQYQVGAAEVASWMRRFPAITLDRIVTHAAVATPAGRKHDPGPRFDLAKFTRYVQATLDGVTP